MTRIFDTNFPKLGRLQTPVILRKRAMIEWLQVLIFPVNMLYQQFYRNRDANLYRLSITPQVVYLEKLLNDRYDKEVKRIRISRPLNFDPVYLYQEDEAKPVFMNQEKEAEPIWLFTEEEVGQSNINFYVFIPAVLKVNVAECKALLDGFILPDKIYKIQLV